jgi:hypothetical protein
MVRDQEGAAERADHIYLIALFQVAQIVRTDSVGFVAAMILGDAFDRQRQL